MKTILILLFFTANNLCAQCKTGDCYTGYGVYVYDSIAPHEYFGYYKNGYQHGPGVERKGGKIISGYWEEGKLVELATGPSIAFQSKETLQAKVDNNSGIVVKHHKPRPAKDCWTRIQRTEVIVSLAAGLIAILTGLVAFLGFLSRKIKKLKPVINKGVKITRSEGSNATHYQGGNNDG